MKKALVIISLTLFSLSFIATSCSDDNPVDFTELLNNYTNKSLQYLDDPYEENCIELKKAIEDYLDSDCKILTDEGRTDLEEELATLTC